MKTDNRWMQGLLPDPKEPFVLICGLDARTRMINKRQRRWWAAKVNRKGIKRESFLSMSAYRRRKKNYD